MILVNGVIIDIKDFFIDWSKPSQNELDYFQMIYNIKLNWSDKEPFPLIHEPSYIDVKYDWKF